MSVKNQISIINDEVKDKAELVVVSKTRSLKQIIEAYDLGHKKFGENALPHIA